MLLVTCLLAWRMCCCSPSPSPPSHALRRCGTAAAYVTQALGVALKLTFQGDNQLVDVHFYLFLAVVVTCLLTQMNYLNKALDLFNTAVVSPIYYVMFTTLTIVASAIMFQVSVSVLAFTGEAGLLE